MTDVSVVVLVWNDRSCLRPCLEALAKAGRGLTLEIVLVENGIRLTASEYAPAAGIPLRVIHNETNRGVAVARNQGFKAAAGRYVMFLDVDTQVKPDALPRLVDFMDANPTVGLAGARLEDAAGNLQYTCRRLPTVASKALRRIPTRWAEQALADEMLADYDHKTPRRVDYVIGACQMIRREAAADAGLLDEGFFYGPEDVDFCIRMWRSGWQVMYVPDAVVVHGERRLTRGGGLSRLSLVHTGNLARYFWKHKYLFTRPRLWNG
jgi:GT2 family glycosyltransferase